MQENTDAITDAVAPPTEPEPDAKEPTQRVRLDLAYDGTNFAGWAIQPTQRTVQEVLEVGLERIFRTKARIPVTVAGRTDTGVHANRQVVHFDVALSRYEAVVGRSSRTPEEALRARLIGVLPHDIVVYLVTPVADSFNARFAALWRRYEYRISDSIATRLPQRRYDTLFHKRELNIDLMNEAAAAVLGHHDFAAFCKARVGATSLRTIFHLHCTRNEAGIVVVDIRADAFCHNMVRSIIGSLITVGEGRKSVAWFAETLESLDRSEASAVIPARGLTLMEIAYPPESEWTARGLVTRRRRDIAVDDM